VDVFLGYTVLVRNVASAVKISVAPIVLYEFLWMWSCGICHLISWLNYVLH